MATLKTDNGGSTVGQEVDDLAFAFVAPLGADDYDTLTHLRKLDTRR
jgi:hypothetical protein